MSDAPVDRSAGPGLGLGQILLSLLGTLALLATSVATLSNSNAGPFVALGGAGALAFVGLWGNVREACLLGFFATLPIMIGKALIDGSPTLAPPGFFFTTPDVFMLPLAAACLATRSSNLRPQPRLTELNWYLVFAGWVLFTTAIMAHQNFVVAALTYLRYIIAGYTIAYAVRSPRDVRIVMYGLIAALFVQVAVAGYQFASKSFVHIPGLLQATVGVNLQLDNGDTFRPSGLTGHPLSLGDFLTFLVPTMMVLLVLGPSRIGRARSFINSALLIVAIGTMIVTLARSAWVATSVAAIVMILIGFRVGLMRWRYVLILVVMALLALVAIWIVYPTFYDRLFDGDSGSTLSRFLMWEQAIKIMGEYPILGVGYAQYKDAAQTICPADFSNYSIAFISTIVMGVVHCKYLLVGAEHGVPGLLLFIWVMWKGARWMFPIAQWRDPLLLAVAIGVTGTMAAQVAYYALDHVFSDMRITMYWSFLGLGAALRAINSRIAAFEEDDTALSPAVAPR